MCNWQRLGYWVMTETLASHPDEGHSAEQCHDNDAAIGWHLPA